MLGGFELYSLWVPLVNIQFLKTMYWGKGTKYLISKGGVYVVVRFYPWFKFYLSFFQIIIIHYHPPKQREITFTIKIKLNHNISIIIFTSLNETILSLLQPKLSQRTTL